MSWTDDFQALERLSREHRARLEQGARVIHVEAGMQVFGPGKEEGCLLLLIEGEMRVQQALDSNRKVVLFRVPAGEACVMPTTYQPSLGRNVAEGVAEGVADTRLRVAVVPCVLCDQLMGESAPFRDLVVGTYSRRLVEICSVIEEIAFRRVDVRLSQRLLRLADDDGNIHATHHQLAAELGTAREVISRKLKEFRSRGWISAGRGVVRIAARNELEKLAQSA